MEVIYNNQCDAKASVGKPELRMLCKTFYGCACGWAEEYFVIVSISIPIHKIQVLHVCSALMLARMIFLVRNLDLTAVC